jgi:hypothetical protein
VLGAVKTEFGKFGEVLKKTREKLNQAADTISAAEMRSSVKGPPHSSTLLARTSNISSVSTSLTIAPTTRLRSPSAGP